MKYKHGLTFLKVLHVLFVEKYLTILGVICVLICYLYCVRKRPNNVLQVMDLFAVAGGILDTGAQHPTWGGPVGAGVHVPS